MQSRREFMRLAAWCGLASIGSLVARNVFAQPFPVQPLPPSTTYAMWTHGTSVQIEYPDIVWKIERRGSSARIIQPRPPAGPLPVRPPGTPPPPLTNWFHFAIPTPVIVADKRAKLHSVILKFVTSQEKVFVSNVHIFDGPNRIAAYDQVRLHGDHGFERFEVRATPEVQWGVGISIAVSFVEGSESWIEFMTAGADFLVPQ
jgi:hypothetical protein